MMSEYEHLWPILETGNWIPEQGDAVMVGDPDRVALLVAHLEGQAGTVRTQLAMLRRTEPDPDVWESDAVERFIEVKERVERDLDAVVERFEAVAGALDVYRPHLVLGQAIAENGAEAAREAHEDLLAARGLQAGLGGMTVDNYNDANPDDPWIGDDPYTNEEDAKERLLAAYATFAAGFETRFDAGNTANETITEAIEDDALAAQVCVDTISTGLVTEAELDCLLPERYHQYLGIEDDEVRQGRELSAEYDGGLFNFAEAEYCLANNRRKARCYSWGKTADAAVQDIPFGDGVTGSRYNALVHINLTASLSLRYGEDTAVLATDIHENILDGEAHGVFDAYRKMDLVNNQIGLDIAQQIRGELASGELYLGVGTQYENAIFLRARELALEAVEEERAVWIIDDDEIPDGAEYRFDRDEYLVTVPYGW